MKIYQKRNFYFCLKFRNFRRLLIKLFCCYYYYYYCFRSLMILLMILLHLLFEYYLKLRKYFHLEKRCLYYQMLGCMYRAQSA